MYLIVWRHKLARMPWKAYEKLFSAKDACWRYAVAMSRDPDWKDREFKIVYLGDAEDWKEL